MEPIEGYSAIQLQYPSSDQSPLTPVLFETEKLDNNLAAPNEAVISDKQAHNDVDTLDSSFQKFQLDVRLEFEKEEFNVSSIDSIDSEEYQSEHRDAHMLSKVGLSCLPRQREQFSKSLGGNFNLMVVGQVGVGKTSFVNTLFDSELLPVSNEFHNPSLSIRRFELVSDNYPLRLCVIETAGFGQNIDNEASWIPISEFIDEQFKLFLFQDQQPTRSNIKDNRIHCCVYLLPPNISSFNTLDLETLKTLSTRVNVIPVISKCDSIDLKTLKTYKAACKLIFEQYDIKFCEFFYDEEVTSLINDSLPFSLINSNSLQTLENGRCIRGRDFPWGFVELEDDSLCDFNLLRKILMSDHMLEFILSTELHYENFRLSFLKSILTDKLNLITTFDNGMEEYKSYKRFGYEKYKESIKENDHVFKYKEENLRAKYNKEISIQEQRFKEWKKALVEKQNELNRDIEKTHDELVELQSLVVALEDKLERNATSISYVDLTSKTTDLKYITS